MALGAATTSSAHTVWIEPKDGRLLLRFAEPGGSFETAPGRLDGLSAPVAFILVTNAAASVAAQRESDGFLLAGASPTNTACAESVFKVRGGRKPVFYARWQPPDANGGAPRLTLDIVPTGKPGECRAYFRGLPLGGAAATLREPDGTERGLVTDAAGFVRFEAKTAGQYLLTIAHHREPLAGYYGGEAYKETSHNCSLAWRQP